MFFVFYQHVSLFSVTEKIMKKIATIQVPCSTSNIGPGFDCIGLALQKYIKCDLFVKHKTEKNKELPNLLLKYYKTNVNEALQIINPYPPGDVFVTNDSKNKIIKSIWVMVESISNDKELEYETIMLEIHNEIPIGVGLGSSGAATITGLLVGSIICDTQVTKREVYKLAYKLEGHPDNITPSIMGGCTISMADIDFIPVKADIFQHLSIGIIIPDTNLSTEEARKALPISYDRSDVVFTIQRCSSLVALLGLSAEQVKASLFRKALGDVVHQKYRANLMPGTPKILSLNDTHLEDPNFYGTAISGAGPSLLLFYHRSGEHLNTLMNSMKTIFETENVKVLHAFVIEVDGQGYTIEKEGTSN